MKATAHFSALTLIFLLSITAAGQTVIMDCKAEGAAERANELWARCSSPTVREGLAFTGHEWLQNGHLMILPVSDGRLKVSTHPEGSRFTARWDDTGIHFLTVTNVPVTEWHERMRWKVYPWGEVARIRVY